MLTYDITFTVQLEDGTPNANAEIARIATNAAFAMQAEGCVKCASVRKIEFVVFRDSPSISQDYSLGHMHAEAAE